MAPPEALVKEIALWFMPPTEDPTLSLAQLGVPDLLSMYCERHIIMEDISSIGVRLAIPKEKMPPVSVLRTGYCYVYLKLLTPLPGKCTLRSMLMGCTLMGVVADNSLIHLRCKIVNRAQPAATSKNFLLFNVDRFGIKDISVWCDEISRMGRGILPPIKIGVDMENLLMEIYTLQNSTGIRIQRPL